MMQSMARKLMLCGEMVRNRISPSMDGLMVHQVKEVAQGRVPEEQQLNYEEVWCLAETSLYCLSISVFCKRDCYSAMVCFIFNLFYCLMNFIQILLKGARANSQDYTNKETIEKKIRNCVFPSQT